MSLQIYRVNRMERRSDDHIRLIAVSNRLPIRVVHKEKETQIVPGAGGLVTALAPVLRDRGGLWIGWSGSEFDPSHLGLLKEASKKTGYGLVPVPLNKEDIDYYYYGFSNEIIWPLFHDLQSRCHFKPKYWYKYLLVNKKFAQVIKEQVGTNDYIWVHDYHLMHAAYYMRSLGLSQPKGFFLHIPFPPVDIFMKLPWRRMVLEALLHYDLIGFQTMRDKRNFLNCLSVLIPEVKIRRRGAISDVKFDGRSLRVGAFPIGIDYKSFARDSASKEVAEAAWYLHEALPDRQVILGIDRLDYTKGIPERLYAFSDALERFPELQMRVSFVQVVVPSRSEVPEYQELKREIERIVGEVNGKFTQSGWVPIHYLYRSLDRTQLLAYYRLAEIALVTPLKDGMNLVCKEYCACNLEGKGVLILSEFAGAAAQLHRGAIMVNPYDIEGVSKAIFSAFSMPMDERAKRMKILRRAVRRKDIFWWVNTFLKAAFAKNLDAFPKEIAEEYIPKN